VAEQIRDVRQPLNGLSRPISDLQRPLHDIAEPLEQLSMPIHSLEQPLAELSPPITNLSKEVGNLHDEVHQLRSMITDAIRDICAAIVLSAAMIGSAILWTRRGSVQTERTVIFSNNTNEPETQEVAEKRPLSMPVGVSAGP
jgi:chromosome segregation ATPase